MHWFAFVLQILVTYLRHFLFPRSAILTHIACCLPWHDQRACALSPSLLTSQLHAFCGCVARFAHAYLMCALAQVFTQSISREKPHNTNTDTEHTTLNRVSSLTWISICKHRIKINVYIFWLIRNRIVCLVVVVIWEFFFGDCIAYDTIICVS